MAEELNEYVPGLNDGAYLTDSANFDTGAIVARHLASDAVETAKIATDAIETAKIASEAVTFNELADQGMITLVGTGTLNVKTSGTVSLLSTNIDSSRGGDNFVAVQAWYHAESAIQTSNTNGVITIEDDSQTSSGLTITVQDNDSANAVRFNKVTAGNAITGLNTQDNNLQARITTVGSAATETASGVVSVAVQGFFI